MLGIYISAAPGKAMLFLSLQETVKFKEFDLYKVFGLRFGLILRVFSNANNSILPYPGVRNIKCFIQGD